MVDVNFDAVRLLDVLQGILNQSQGLKAQEVHLDEADRLDDMTIILGHNDILLGIFILNGTNRSYISQVIGTNDNTACMDAYLPVCVLQFGRIG